MFFDILRIWVCEKTKYIGKNGMFSYVSDDFSSVTHPLAHLSFEVEGGIGFPLCVLVHIRNQTRPWVAPP